MFELWHHKMSPLSLIPYVINEKGSHISINSRNVSEGVLINNTHSVIRKTLTLFTSMPYFYTPRKRFLTFSGDIEIGYWREKG